MQLSLCSQAHKCGQDMNNVNVNGGRLPGSFMGHPVSNGGHFNVQLGAGAFVNLKLPSAWQAQWSAMPSPLHHTTSLGNAVDSGTMNGLIHGSMSPSSGISHAVPGQGAPVRTPSANGSREVLLHGIASYRVSESRPMGSLSHLEAAICPKERTAMILSEIEWEMLRQKDRDHQ